MLKCEYLQSAKGGGCGDVAMWLTGLAPTFFCKSSVGPSDHSWSFGSNRCRGFAFENECEGPSEVRSRKVLRSWWNH
jgi:hypothetical protein